MNRSFNYLAGIGYATIFGFSFLVTKDALVALDPFELLFLRFAVAALAMTLLLSLRLIRVDFRGKLIGRSLDRPSREARLDLALACLFQPILYFASETFGVRDSASSTAGIVLGALPAVVAVLGAVMLKEHLALRQAASLCLSVIGVVVIAIWGVASKDGGGDAGSLRGFLFLFGAVASSAFYNIFSRKSSRVFTPVETTFAMMWTGAICFGAIALARGSAMGANGVAGSMLARAAPAWAGILYLGLLSSVVAFFLINFTLSRLKASQSVVFANLVTVISVAAGVLIRGEAFGAVQALGAVMIALGVWGTNAAGKGCGPKDRALKGSALE